VRVIDPDGEQLGVLTLQEARAEAERRELDLIEVAPAAKPPVCRIMDYGKFRYQLQKKAKDAQKKSRQVEIKGIRLRPNTDDHDLDFKLKATLKFLEKGNKVKFTVIFRGPELRHKDIGERQLKSFIDGTAEIAKVDSPPRMEGRRMTMVLEPLGEEQLAQKRAAAERDVKRKADEEAAATAVTVTAPVEAGGDVVVVSDAAVAPEPVAVEAPIAVEAFAPPAPEASEASAAG
jgi:translation initiation factor IF-3